MKTDDLLLLAVIVGGGAYLIQRKTATAGGSGANVAANGFVLPTFPPPTNFNPVPSQNGSAGSTGPDGYQTAAAFVGTALTDLTGIPGFSQAGQAIAGLIGKGRKQADKLVQTYQNPMLQDHAGTIIAAWHRALDTGKASGQVKEMVKQQLISMVEQFKQIASEPQFSIAGPGGIATADHILNDIWLPNIDLEWQQRGVA